MDTPDPHTCPACGGAGGGPFGRAGSAWDDEDYVCPRCKGRGALVERVPLAGPGITKTAASKAPKKKRASGQN